MKLNMKRTEKNCKGMASCATKTTKRATKLEASAKTGVTKRFRRLKKNEVVWHGDFIADGRLGFEPWEGPGGFRADAFVRPIYRQDEGRSTATKKSK